MRNSSKTKSDADREANIRRSALEKYVLPSHSNEYRASMHWGVACIKARADVYAMMIGPLTDDHTRHSPDYVDEGDVQSVL